MECNEGSGGDLASGINSTMQHTWLERIDVKCIAAVCRDSHLLVIPCALIFLDVVFL